MALAIDKDPPEDYNLEYARCFFLVAAFRFVEILPVETAVETTAEGANEMIEIQWRMVRWAFLL